MRPDPYRLEADSRMRQSTSLFWIHGEAPMNDHVMDCDRCGSKATVNDVEVMTHPDRPYQVLGINYEISCPVCGERTQTSLAARQDNDNPEPPH
jgi:rRNA maturation protein Nop10